MFVFGEAKEKVIDGKVALPKEFHLKDINLIGKWENQNTLYLSDNEGSLNFAAGSRGARFIVEKTVDDRILVPSRYDNMSVLIKGCITTIELIFISEYEENAPV